MLLGRFLVRNVNPLLVKTLVIRPPATQNKIFDGAKVAHQDGDPPKMDVAIVGHKSAQFGKDSPIQIHDCLRRRYRRVGMSFNIPLPLMIFSAVSSSEHQWHPRGFQVKEDGAGNRCQQKNTGRRRPGVPDPVSRQECSIFLHNIVRHAAHHEYKVVDNALKIESSNAVIVCRLKLLEQILSEDGEVEVLKGLARHNSLDILRLALALIGIVALLATDWALRHWFAKRDLLTKNAEVWLVRGQSQHDQISIKTLNDVAGVGIVAGLLALAANELHDLVLAFTRNGCVGKHNLDVFPGIIMRHLCRNEGAKILCKTIHERGSGRDDV
eukprot:m.135587 g.135587  ORF g.135587 m.135587 type:complete len:326 (-) comp9887_c0_seq4:482-1459(-)